jgi:hypothetical protein
MSTPNPWKPKSLLDEHPWSLIPDVGLSKGASRASLVAWLVLVAVAATLSVASWQSLLSGAIAGSWAVYYVAARLGGRPAMTGGASAAIRSDSSFQARLAFDVTSLLVFAIAVYLVGFSA